MVDVLGKLSLFQISGISGKVATFRAYCDSAKANVKAQVALHTASLDTRGA